MALTAACGIPLGVAEEGSTGADTDDNNPCFAGGVCNGVAVVCQNHNAPPGADVTGDPGEVPNYWWRAHDPETDPALPDEDNPICGPNVGAISDYCCFQGLTSCFLKERGNSPFYEPSQGPPTCVGAGFGTTPLDPMADWAEGNYPGTDGAYDEAIRAACSAQCAMKPDGTNADPLCEDDNWSNLQTLPGWEPDAQSDNFNCVVTSKVNEADPDGSEIPWHLVGGPSSPVLLGCELDAGCVDWFYPTVDTYVFAGRAGFIEPETRTAHYLAVENSGSNIELDVDASGAGAGVDDTEPVFGLAEYTAVNCGDDVCPFFLANLSAYNTTDSWDIRITTDLSTRIKKSVSDVQIDLLQSTLGVHHLGLGKVAFAPGSLRLRVQVTVASYAPNSSYGDGTHAAIIENDDYVFADYENGALNLVHTFAFQTSGEATLTLGVVPDEHPPTADHDLGTTEACDDTNGLVLDASHVLSDDPDDDIVVDLWWVDGFPCGSECVLPFGAHEVAIEARDARGAVDRTAEQWVYVMSGC